VGCDIHLYAEKRVNGKWTILPPPLGTGFDFSKMPKPGKPWDQLTPAEKEAHQLADTAYRESVKAPWRFEHAPRDEANPALVAKEKGERRYLQKWFSDRNYRLFGMLAGVRNSSGGWPDRERDETPIVEPIHEPRGVPGPGEASKEYRAEVRAYGVDGHSHSWATVAELRTYLSLKATESYLERGVLDGGSYEALITEKKRPESWSGGIGGQGIITLDAATYNALRPHVTVVDAVNVFREHEAHLTVERAPAWWKRMHPQGTATDLAGVLGWRIYVNAKWEVPYLDVIGNFVELLYEVEANGGGAATEDLRLVYFFDN
jgi:hypothetical protein